jgi:hypothetical protein
MTSEGTKSAERIEREYGRQFRPYPTTVPELELQETEAQRVRRVLAPSGCNQDCNQGRNCNCAKATERKPGLWKSWRW